MALQEEIKSRRCMHAKGPVSLGIKAGDFIYLSAQLPFDPHTKKIVSDDFEEQAERCLKNMEYLLRELGLSNDYVLKTTVCLTDMDNFDLFNEIYARHFHKPYPARLSMGVISLPYGAKISIDACAVDTRALEVIIASEEEYACEQEGICCIDENKQSASD